MEQGEQQNKTQLADDWQHLVGGARLEDLAAAIASGSRKIFSQGLSQWGLYYGLARMLPGLKRTLLLITASPKQAWEAHRNKPGKPIRASHSFSALLNIGGGTPWNVPFGFFPQPIAACRRNPLSPLMCKLSDSPFSTHLQRAAKQQSLWPRPKQ
jgi:hypothetical protein